MSINTASASRLRCCTNCNASDITNGTAGASAVVDASQLKVVNDAIPASVIASIAEGGTDIVAGALQITTDASG